MEFVLWKVLGALAQSQESAVCQVLKSESKRLEITKSLLNVLHNIAVVQNIQLSARRKADFSKYTDQVHQLLSKTSTSAKAKLLSKHPGLVKLIAVSCPKPAELSS